MDALQQGRDAYGRRAWAEAEACFARADGSEPLAVEDVERWSVTAYMLGEDEAHCARLQRAYRERCAAGDGLGAAQDAIFLGIHLLSSGRAGQAGGWLGRAERLVDEAGVDCVQRGYLMVPGAFAAEWREDLDEALALVRAAAAVADRFGDADLGALTRQMTGRMLIKRGDVEAGLRELDEAMVAVSAGELSPIPSGIVFCAVIGACQLAYEVRRAREWTTELAEWCEAQPDMVAFSGTCRVHRAELLRLQGDWSQAAGEAARARDRCLKAMNARSAAAAACVRGDVHRLRGELAEAEAAYREASGHGSEPQPGLALLRLAQGETQAAAAAVRRALQEAPAGPARARLLAAAAEIGLAAGDDATAREAAAQLERLAAHDHGGMLTGMAGTAAGALALADGDAAAALKALRPARAAWDDLPAPYEAARARELIGLACRALGDEDGARLELDGARQTFAALGAAPDVARLDGRGPAGGAAAHGLTARELEVLRMVARGATNRAIASELVLSEKTIDRHVSNILAKLRVASRAAATAFAYEHRLL